VINPTRREFLEAITSAPFFAQLTYPQERSDDTRLRNRRDWQAARDRILAAMQLVMGKLPAQEKRSVDVVKLKSEDLSGFTRAKIAYQSEPGDYVPAWLLVPRSLKRRAPAMLCLHQTTSIGKDEPAGLGGNPDLHYAKELAERGFVTISPDYPYLGENKFDPYKNGYVSCTLKGIVNHRRAVDVLESLPEVDTKRIGSIGHSLGGHNTLFLAAFDERIRIMITSCGFNSFKKYYGGDLTGWSGIRYMPLIGEAYGNTWSRMPFDFSDVLIALAPRPLFINAPLRDSNFEVSGVKDCVEKAMPIYGSIFRAKDKLVAQYPDVGHEFPRPIRESAYAFLEGN
jgi:Acetyl xylan esterase (AXE1)